jgi:hypothetical protein
MKSSRLTPAPVSSSSAAPVSCADNTPSSIYICLCEGGLALACRHGGPLNRLSRRGKSEDNEKRHADRPPAEHHLARSFLWRLATLVLLGKRRLRDWVPIRGHPCASVVPTRLPAVCRNVLRLFVVDMGKCVSRAGLGMQQLIQLRLDGLRVTMLRALDEQSHEPSGHRRNGMPVEGFALEGKPCDAIGRR